MLQGEIPEGRAPYFRLPIFNYHDGFLSTSYNATYYELAQRHPEVPRLTDLQREAIRHFNALARVRCCGRARTRWSSLDACSPSPYACVRYFMAGIKRSAEKGYSSCYYPVYTIDLNSA